MKRIAVELRAHAAGAVERSVAPIALATCALFTLVLTPSGAPPARAQSQSGVACELEPSQGAVTCRSDLGFTVDADGFLVGVHERVREVTTTLNGLDATLSTVGSEIRVSAGQSIQDAINMAVDGDRIIVEPGVYFANLDFLGKAISVESEQGPAVTVIDGGTAGLIVVFQSGEGRDSVLRGFTLRNGSGDEGGAIGVYDSSPSILENVISDNSASFGGGGIGMGFASPLIQGNMILRNSSGGLGGGGISIRGASTAEIIGNEIAENTASEGGALALFAAGAPLIQDNILRDNVSTTSSSSFGGGAINMVNRSDADIIQNLIIDNSANLGGGLAWLVPSGARGPLLVNNTIANNDSPIGSAIAADGFDRDTLLVNNVIVALNDQTAVFCGDFNDLNPPIFQFNDVFSPLGDAYGGICSDQTGLDGNISADPMFSDPDSSNFRLTGDSLCIDAGYNVAPEIPLIDLDGYPRIDNGLVDMGAYETSTCLGDMDNVVISDVTYPAGMVFGCSAVLSITSGPAVTVSAGSDITYTAPSVALLPGFSVEVGGTLRVISG